MSKSTITIDGAKLKTLLENATGRDVRDLGAEFGYSKSVFANAIRRGKASPNIISLAKHYGIEPSAYELKPATSEDRGANTSEDGKQVTFEDLITEDGKEALRGLIKETLLETLNSFACSNITGEYNKLNRVFTIQLKIK